MRERGKGIPYKRSSPDKRPEDSMHIRCLELWRGFYWVELKVQVRQ